MGCEVLQFHFSRIYFELSVINVKVIDSICKITVSCDKTDPGNLSNGR